MNATQLKYARERARDIFGVKMAELARKYTAKPLTTEEAIEALLAGKFKIVEPEKHYSNQWYNRVSFDASPKVDAKAYQEEKDNLQEQYRSLMDELILGDNEEALKLLKAFETNG